MDTCTRYGLTSKHLHTQHKESSPSLLHSRSGYSFHSSALQDVQRRKTNTPWSVCEVPFNTRFIKLILPQFHSKPVQTKTKDAHTAKCKFWVWVKCLSTKNVLVKWRNRPLGDQFELGNDSGHFMSKNDCYEPQNHESLQPIHLPTQKQISWAWKMRKMTGKHEEDIPILGHYKNDLPSMGNMR